MALQSLYREFRPASFAQIVGQDQVVKPLVQEIQNGSVGHAYLFSGSRGLGKTSVARLFAKSLKVSDKDIYEIDAASNNSVEDIRNLTENIYTLPFESSYKFYILDEAQMLSKSAWNAFLKTLEEPPKHAIFVLATTELNKIPETVQSRCEVFEFRKPSRKDLSEFVNRMGKWEAASFEKPAADLIAILADGSYRDALSIVGKIISEVREEEHQEAIKKMWEKGETSATFTIKQNFTLEEVERFTGAPKHELVLGLVRALSAGDGGSALSAIRAADTADVDMHLYLTLVLETLRTVLLIRHAPELRKELAEEVGSDVYPELEKLSLDSASKLTHETLRTFLDAASRMRFSPVPAASLELAVLELAPKE